MSVDATKPTDTDPIAEHAERIRDLAVVANAAEAAAGGDLSRAINPDATTQTLVTADMNAVIPCANAGAITKTLPLADAAMVGNWVRFHKNGAGNLAVTPNGTDTIADFGAGVSVTNSTAAEALASFIEMECTAIGQWNIAGILGTWA